MQQNQQGRRFADSQPQQPVYRFPQNQPAYHQADQRASSDYDEQMHMSRRDRRALKRAHKHKRRRIFTFWNLFAVIGVVTVIIQAIRYLIIPLLIYLNTLTGGAL